MGFQTHTRNLGSGETFTPTREMNITSISMQMSTGASDEGSYQGSLTLGGVASQVVSIGPGQGRVLVTPDPNNKPITGQVFTCVSGIMTLEISV